MKKSSKILIILLVIVTSVAMIFTACDKDEQPVDTRPQTVDRLASVALKAQNNSWKADMTEAEIKALSSPATYVVAREWTLFFADVIERGSLQEGKISRIADYLESADGKALVGGEVDVNNFFDVVRSIGFTGTDVETLVYDVLHTFISEGEGVYNRAIADIEMIMGDANLTAEARENAHNQLVKMQSGRDSFKHASLGAEETIKALEDAESGVKNLISFTYNTAMLFGDGSNSGLFEALQEGSLEGASTSEVATYLSSVVSSVKDMSATIESYAVSIQSAINSLMGFYDLVAVADPTIETIFTVVSNYKTLPTVLPLACDFVENLETIALKGDDYSFIEGVMGCFKEGYTEEYDGANLYIAWSRLILAMLGIDYSESLDTITTQWGSAKEVIVDLMNELVVGGNAGVGKDLSIYLAFMLNSESEDDNINGVKTERFASFVLADIYLKQFKKHYREYKSGVVTAPDSLISSANFLMKYYSSESNVNINTNFTTTWYEGIVNGTLSKMESERTPLYEAAYYEMDGLTKTLTTTFITGLLDMASLTPQKVGTDGYTALKAEVENIYTQIAEAILG